MESFVLYLLGGLLFAAGLFISHLCDRVSRIEKRLGQDSEDLVKAVNRVSCLLLRPGPEQTTVQGHDLYDSLKIIDRISYRIAANTPGLRRVLVFSIAVKLSYFREKTGITAEDLTGLEEQLAPEAFWPASSVVIEEWATHTVIRDRYGQRDVLYPGRHPPSFEPVAIWRHALPKRQDESGLFGPAYLEVVLHEKCVKFWARDGRFKRRIPPGPEARRENVFVVLPLNEESLAQYRSRLDDSSEENAVEIDQAPWIRHYQCGDLYLDFQTWWDLTIIDVVEYVADRC